MKELFDKNVLFDVRDFGGMSEDVMNEYVSEKTVTYMKYLYVRIAIGVLMGALLIGVSSVMFWGLDGIVFIFMGGMLGGSMARALYGNKRERAMLRLRSYERSHMEELAKERKRALDRESRMNDTNVGINTDKVTYMDNVATRKYREGLQDTD